MKNILHHLKNIKDNRCNQGKRYKLFSIVGLVLTGYMSGCTSLAMVYNFGQNLSKKNRRKLGFKDTMPSHPTITQTMKKIDPGDFETILGHIVITNTNIDFKQIAIDGKSIRSTSGSAEGLLHLVSALPLQK